MEEQPMISTENLAFEYIRRDENDNVIEIVRAIDGVTETIQKGSFIAILGANGSGKSTFAKHLNALLMPTEGTVWVDGMDTADEKNTLSLRQHVGMVFQNPDNQIIGTLVEEDVAFGPENIGIETAQIWNRVAKSLKLTDMDAFRYSSPNRLSGGQKQKVAIAGILAMEPACIILDEATSMLDPKGRREVLEAVTELNQKEHITIILITHYMEEAFYAEHVFIMNQGKMVLSGTPREIFLQEDLLLECSLELPPLLQIASDLRKQGVPLPKNILTQAELIESLQQAAFPKEGTLPLEPIHKMPEQAKENQPPLLVLDHVFYSYDTNGRKQKHMPVSISYAVNDLSLSIGKNEFLALIGATGSGKSTLLQLMNGLLQADHGTIYFHGQDIRDKDFPIQKLRHKIGLVFQYPEYQLFETTIVNDVMFGPKNQGLTLLQAQINTFEALKLCGIGEDLFDVSPFDLSGGQKRRVAIAGILAMKPELMILDEPGAGLDPKGKRELFTMLKTIQQETGMSVLIVSHSMEDAAEYADRIFMIKEGRILLSGEPEQLFTEKELLQSAGLDIPIAAKLAENLYHTGFLTKKNTRKLYTKQQIEYAILKALKEGHR